MTYRCLRHATGLGSVGTTMVPLPLHHPPSFSPTPPPHARTYRILCRRHPPPAGCRVCGVFGTSLHPTPTTSGVVAHATWRQCAWPRITYARVCYVLHAPLSSTTCPTPPTGLLRGDPLHGCAPAATIIAVAGGTCLHALPELDGHGGRLIWVAPIRRVVGKHRRNNNRHS